MKVLWSTAGDTQKKGQTAGAYSTEAALQALRIFGTSATVAAGTARKLGATEYLVQAGWQTVPRAGTGIADVTFPHPFPTALITVFFQPLDYNNHYWISSAYLGVTGFRAAFATDQATYTIGWVALGY